MKKHKKYSVLRLYIVNIIEDNKTYRFICEYDKGSDIYKEIFTDEQIKKEDITSIEKLSSYYSNSEICKWALKEIDDPLMLSKKEILKKYIELNNMNVNKIKF